MDILIRQRSQTERTPIPFPEMSRIHRSIETRSRLTVALGAGVGGGVDGSEDCYEWVWSFFEGDRKVLKLMMMMVAQLCEYTKDH